MRAMLAGGLTEDGAGQALGGWPKARVTARMRLLELPEAAQQLEAKVAQRAAEKKASRGRGEQPADPLADGAPRNAMWS